MDNLSVTKLFGNQATEMVKDGKAFLVVPGVPVQEQVMNTYLVEAGDIQKSLLDWDGTPLSIRHAQKNNGSVRVENPDVPIIGEFHSPRWDNSTKRMLGDYWFDKEKALTIQDGQLIINAIEAGNILETSTAYWADEDYVAGSHNGRSYSTVHRNLKPDHIAVFPPNDQIGACSIRDGCGINRNEAMIQNCDTCPQKVISNMTGNLPQGGKSLWEEVYNANKEKYGEERAAKIAWTAVENAGWHRKGKEWVKKNEQIPEFVEGHLPTEMLIGYAVNKGSRTQEQLDLAKASTEKDGKITKPVWVQWKGDNSFLILDGNHRVFLANELGIDQVPVKIVNCYLEAMEPEAVYREWLHEQDQGYLR